MEELEKGKALFPKATEAMLLAALSHGGFEGAEIVGAVSTALLWRRGRSYHRGGDRPALIKVDGTCEWWENGERHRGGGRPAVERADGRREWWVRGKRHRDEGPAVVSADGKRFEWWRDGSRQATPAEERAEFERRLKEAEEAEELRRECDRSMPQPCPFMFPRYWRQCRRERNCCVLCAVL